MGVTAVAKNAPHAGVSVVVPARNREALIEPCLDHLLAACRQLMKAGPSGEDPAGPVEVLVVDDASEDATARVVERMAHAPQVPCPLHLLRFTDRQGPARARNAGVERASGELIVFVDSDVLVVPEFLRAHVAAHRHYGPLALVGGSVRLVNSVEEALRRPRATLWDLSSNPLDTANASVRREHLLRVGLFDAGFDGMGWEDIDLGLRLLAAGLVRRRAPAAVGYHVKPPLTGPQQLAGLLGKERERGRTARYFLSKHPGLAGRMTVQGLRIHRWMSWMWRMGGLVRPDNVLQWMAVARRWGLEGVGRMWLSGVLTDEYLKSFYEAPPGPAGSAGPA